MYLSTDEARRKVQIEQRDMLSSQLKRIPAVISESIVIEILAEVVRQSGRHPCPEEVASALAIRGLPVAESEVAAIFDQYDIEKKTLASR